MLHSSQRPHRILFRPKFDRNFGEFGLEDKLNQGYQHISGNPVSHYKIKISDLGAASGVRGACSPVRLWQNSDHTQPLG